MFNIFSKKEKNHPILLSKDNLSEFINNTEMVRIIMFSASWCGACKMMKPIFNDLCSENNKLVTQWGIVDTELEPEIAQSFNIRSLPTIIIFKKSELIYQGPFIPKMSFQQKIDELLK